MAITVPFKKPVKFEDQTVEKIEMDLDVLTGRDISQVKSEWAASGKFSPVPAADMDFCILIASRGSNLPKEFFEALPGKEFMRVAQEVSNFLLASD